MESNLLNDLWFNAYIIREYIPMNFQYTAFWGNMPVNPERRYLIRDGKVIAHFPYWIKESIDNPSQPDWRKLSDKMNRETKGEIKLL